MSSDIQLRAKFDFVRYANVWEDADILCEALLPGPDKRILSIASSGDNCFALLAGGAEVVAADLNPAQLASVELKRAAIRHLSHLELLEFFGINSASPQKRTETYRRLAPDLSPGARKFWDNQPLPLARGFIHDGKFEKYFHTFRALVLPLLHSTKRVHEVFEPKDLAGRKAFYDKVWDNRRWRLLFGIFFGKLLLGRLGRDPEFFKYVEGSVSSRLRARTEYAFTVLDPSENPYLSYILCGNFTRAEIRETDLSEGSPTAMALPRYLRPGVLPKVKEHLERLSLYQGTIESAARIGDGFDGYNLSDLFEYLSPERTAGVYRALVECSRRKARFAYWNMLVPRSCPKELEGKVRHLETLSRELYRRDKAFFYSAFIVDEAQ